jgi:hypothetical protein
MVLEWMGPDRVIYGSDAPPLTSLKPRAIKLINDLDLPAAERDAIFWANAARLLKLPLARAAHAAGDHQGGINFLRHPGGNRGRRRAASRAC